MPPAAPTDTLCARFQATVARAADDPALTTLDGRVLRWAEYGKRVTVAAAALDALDLHPGGALAFRLGNRPAFHVADAAALHLGVPTVSLDAALPRAAAEAQLADARATILITESRHVADAIAIRCGGRTALEHIVCVDGHAPEALGWDEFEALSGFDFDFEARWRAVGPDDLATLVYTSGTTGPPRGVELTHANLVAQADAVTERLALRRGLRVLSYLPMAHIAERLCTQYLPLHGAWSVTCCPEEDRVSGALRRTRPDLFFSPPRLWERLRAALLASAGDAERRELAAAAARVRAGAGVQDGPAQRAARARVGLDAVEVALVGSAPAPRELLVFWHACGIRLSELYGLSETTGVVTVARPAAARIGSAGPPLDGVDATIAADGEILVRGPIVARGYRGSALQTTPDGWLRTGDAGVMHADGGLRVGDRLADRFTTAAGAVVSPATVETAVRSAARLIGQVCVFGRDRQHVIALLTLEPDALRVFAAEIDLPDASLRRLAQSARVLETVRDEVRAANATLAPPARVHRFVVLEDEWRLGGEELTATMKPRRGPIAARYATVLERLEAGHIGLATDPALAATRAKV